jgi:DNA-binding transcriptional LysR family regulator
LALFERRAGGLSLTSAGAELAGHASEVLSPVRRYKAKLGRSLARSGAGSAWEAVQIRA